MSSTVPGTGPQRFVLREKMFDIGEKMTVTDADGRPAFLAESRALSFGRTFTIMDLEGSTLVTLKRPLASLLPQATIIRPGQPDAEIKQKIALLGKKYHVDLPGEDLEVTGNITGHEFEIKRGRDVVARISKKWLAVHDTYGIEVEPGEDAGLMIAIGVAIEGFELGG